jgi:hypothetical protein
VSPLPVRTEIAGGAFVHFTADGDEVAQQSLDRLVAALEAAPDVDVAVASFVHGSTYVGAHVTNDPLFDLLAGAPFIAPAAAYLVRARFASGAWSDAPPPWAAREYFARIALRGARFIAVERAVARAKPVAEIDDVEIARATFARLREAAAGVATVAAHHRVLLEQPWGRWRVGTTIVHASPRTRALGAIGTVVGQELARSAGARTIEGWTTHLRARMPRLERAVLRTREAIESLAADGLLVAEGA